MNKKSKDFHPFIKACAMLGAVSCGFFAIALFVSSLVALPNIFTVLVGCSKAILISMLSWAFWYAGKFGKNSFLRAPFRKQE